MKNRIENIKYEILKYAIIPLILIEGTVLIYYLLSQTAGNDFISWISRVVYILIGSLLALTHWFIIYQYIKILASDKALVKKVGWGLIFVPVYIALTSYLYISSMSFNLINVQAASNSAEIQDSKRKEFVSYDNNIDNKQIEINSQTKYIASLTNHDSDEYWNARAELRRLYREQSNFIALSKKSSGIVDPTKVNVRKDVLAVLYAKIMKKPVSSSDDLLFYNWSVLFLLFEIAYITVIVFSVIPRKVNDKKDDNSLVPAIKENDKAKNTLTIVAQNIIDHYQDIIDYAKEMYGKITGDMYLIRPNLEICRKIGLPINRGLDIRQYLSKIKLPSRPPLLTYGEEYDYTTYPPKQLLGVLELLYKKSKMQLEAN